MQGGSVSDTTLQLVHLVYALQRHDLVKIYVLSEKC